MPLLIGSVAALSVAALVLGFAQVFRHLVALRRRHALERRQLPRDPPSVVILVPARDEARNVEACLRSLLAQDYPRSEVWMLDDGSSDDTLAIAERVAAEAPAGELRVVRGGNLLPGWMGKSNALRQLVEQAPPADWYFFVDADTVHAPDSLSTGMGFALHHELKGLSASGPRVVGSFWERVWEPVWPTFLFGFLDPDAIDDPRRDAHFAIGQWLLVERAAYEAIGGHGAVRAEIVEDCALARELQRGGHGYRMLLSTRLFEVRMYRGLGEVWHGWSKNAYRALVFLGCREGGVLLGAAALLLATVGPFIVAGLASLGLAAELPTGLTHGPMLLALAAAWAVRAEQRASPRYFWTLPLAGLLAAGVILNSWWRTRTGRSLRWKGRGYPGGVPPAQGE